MSSSSSSSSSSSGKYKYDGMIIGYDTNRVYKETGEPITMYMKYSRGGKTPPTIISRHDKQKWIDKGYGVIEGATGSKKKFSVKGPYLGKDEYGKRRYEKITGGRDVHNDAEHKMLGKVPVVIPTAQIKYLATKQGLTPKTVKSIIRDMDAVGLIELEEAGELLPGVPYTQSRHQDYWGPNLETKSQRDAYKRYEAEIKKFRNRTQSARGSKSTRR